MIVAGEEWLTQSCLDAQAEVRERYDAARTRLGLSAHSDAVASAQGAAVEDRDPG